jgi:hypothetical protein
LDVWQASTYLTSFVQPHHAGLWKGPAKTRRRDIVGPTFIRRYLYLAGGQPELMPGIDELARLAAGAETPFLKNRASLPAAPRHPHGRSRHDQKRERQHRRDIEPGQQPR